MEGVIMLYLFRAMMMVGYEARAEKAEETKIVLFADDRNILLTDKNLKSLNAKIQAVMNQIANWFMVNDLIINTEKTKTLFFQGCSPSIIHKPDL
jgi:hypothetical protein